VRTAAQPPESEWVQALARRLRFAEVKGANREPPGRFAVQEWGVRFARQCGRLPRSAAVCGGSTQGANPRTANPESRGHTSEMSRCSPPYGTFPRKDPFLPRQRGFCATVASPPLGSSRQSLAPRGVKCQHGSKSTTAIGICCTPKNGLTWQLPAAVRVSLKALETTSDHPPQVPHPQTSDQARCSRRRLFHQALVIHVQRVFRKPL
jgi:hypothetical protein